MRFFRAAAWPARSRAGESSVRPRLGRPLPVLAGAVALARADRYDESAWRMVRAEMSPPQPMSKDVLPGLWTVAGRVAPDGRVLLTHGGRDGGTDIGRQVGGGLDDEIEIGRHEPPRVNDQ